MFLIFFKVVDNHVLKELVKGLETFLFYFCLFFLSKELKLLLIVR